jgi:5-oxoprolinase (ATP-hydrolysing) subunit A
MNASVNPITPLLRSIDLNADLGEGFPHDRALLELVSSASISCGAHAGGTDEMLRTLHDAKALNVKVGAHPGYPDRPNFGRKEQSISALDLIEMIQPQLELLATCAQEAGVSIHYLKPHGALYNQAQRDQEIAAGVLAIASRWNLPLLGQPGSVLETMARDRGHPYFAEGFPDRRYRADGSLLPRSEPRAIIDDLSELEEQLLRLAANPQIQTLCIHGDDPRAIDNATRIRKTLLNHGIPIQPFVSESQ